MIPTSIFYFGGNQNMKKSIINFNTGVVVDELNTTDYDVEVKYNIDWEQISKSKLSDEFILTNADMIIYQLQFKNKKLSENFIESFYDALSNEVTKRQFLRWCTIHQKLSSKFIKKHFDELSWFLLTRYQKVPDGIFENKKNFKMFVIK